MSVSQMKKRYAELEAYLGRDVEGLKKLKAFKDEVNELRTTLASAEAKVVEMETAFEAQAKRVRELSAAGEAMDAELHRLQQLYDNLQRDMKAVIAAAEPPEEEVKWYGKATDELEMKRVVKRLRSRLSFCPRPTRTSGELATAHVDCCRSRWVDVFDRESIAAGWSHDALWTLGAAVAALAALRGVVVIETDPVLQIVGHHEPDSNESVWRQLYQWFMKNNVDFAALEKAAESDVPGSTKPPSFYGPGPRPINLK
jgi:hypothetical protein